VKQHPITLHASNTGLVSLKLSIALRNSSSVRGTSSWHDSFKDSGTAEGRIEVDGMTNEELMSPSSIDASLKHEKSSFEAVEASVETIENLIGNFACEWPTAEGLSSFPSMSCQEYWSALDSCINVEQYISVCYGD